MSTKWKVDEFEAWLRAHGTPAELALFNRSVVQGFLAVAGAQAVTAAHIATSVELARDAGIDVAAMEELGALVVRFARSQEPTERAAPIEEVAAPVEELAAPVEEVAAPIAPPSPESAPLVVSFRDNDASAPAAIAATAPSKPSRAPTAPPRAPTAPPSSSRPRSRRTAIVAAAGAVIVVGISVAVTLRARNESSTDDAAPAPTHVEHLPHVALDAQFPAGWHVAADPRAADAAAPTAAIVVRGGTAADPEQAVFVAALPLADELAVGAEITNAALLRAARHAERGTAARVTVDGGNYKPAGCAVSALGAHIAVCRGTAKQGAQAIAVQTFVRIGEDRAIVALFVAKPAAGDTAREAEQIVGSLGL